MKSILCATAFIGLLAVVYGSSLRFQSEASSIKVKDDCNPALCQKNQTCCASSKYYSCCPFEEATCCPGGIYCCPKGTHCDMKTGLCKDNVIFHAMARTQSTKQSKEGFLIKLSSSEVLESVVCPDGQSQCADGQTCCKLTSGQYGCCPMPNAVCCSDGVHCCPQGTTCDVSAGTCSRGLEVFPMVKKQSALPVNSVVCPDGQSQCADGQTCCKLASGQYGCCPMPNAVCCSDGVHCCPQGTTCDVSAGTCSRGLEVFPMVKKQSALSVNSVVCPDGQSQCADGQTCCKLASGQYGCCPMPSAVCCSDGVHCCPQGTTCDVSAGTCSRGLEVFQMVQKQSALTLSVKSPICPDGKSKCKAGQTCCKLASGQFGCCPFDNAVCCSDGEHCCPQYSKCNLATGVCDNGLQVFPWFNKQPALEVNSVVCPDGQSQCGDGQTCCKLASGQYGCCPMPNAVCCSDGVHCCPQGTTCDVSAGTCSRGLEVYAMMVKEASKPVQTNVCPDGVTKCGDDQTCCKNVLGRFGCCNAPNAVCCPDGEHCCPGGTSCDLRTHKCVRRGLPMVDMMPKKQAAPVEQTVVCPGGQSQCDEGKTCCQMATGEYGCCPLPNATCCSDGQHCCPQGYKCTGSSCNRTEEHPMLALIN